MAALSAAGICPPECLVTRSGSPSPFAINFSLCCALPSPTSPLDQISRWQRPWPFDVARRHVIGDRIKALDPEWLDILLHGYGQRQYVVRAAAEGVSHSFTTPRPLDVQPVRNHGSTRRYHTALARSLAEGRASGTYLLVDSSVACRWRLLRFSPFGCVPKSGVDPEVEARLIRNLSYPNEDSVNMCSDQDQFPPLEFEPARQ